MQAMRGRKEMKASKVKFPQRQPQPPPPQEPQPGAAAASTNPATTTAAATVGTDNKRIFPSRHLDVPALYETQVSNWDERLLT